MLIIDKNKEINRLITKEKDCWAGCDIALDVKQGFDEKCIKDLVLNVYFKCDNVKYYQALDIMYYYKNYDQCFGTNKLITISHGEKNKWKFKVKVEITKSSSPNVTLISDRILSDGSKESVQCQSSKLLRSESSINDTKKLLPSKPISSQCYHKTSQQSASDDNLSKTKASTDNNRIEFNWKNPRKRSLQLIVRNGYIMNGGRKRKKIKSGSINRNNFEEEDIQYRPYKHYGRISDEHRYSENHMMYAVDNIMERLQLLGELSSHEPKFDFIPSIDCFATKTNRNEKLPFYITKETDFFSPIYNDPTYWKDHIAWCCPPYQRKMIVDTLNLFKPRQMKGYVMVPFEVTQSWIVDAKRMCKAWHVIRKRKRTILDAAPLPWTCWFDTIVFYFNFRQ